MKIKRSYLKKTNRTDAAFYGLGFLIMIGAVCILILLFLDMWGQGAQRLSLNFFTQFASRYPEKAGLLSAWVGTLLVVILTALVSIPMGILTAIYLEEYAPKNRLTRFLELNINNLAGVPSIVFGVTSLGLFVYGMGFGHSLLTAALTLALLILPIIIIATKEALKTVPQSLREASYALGANKWQTTFMHVLPYSMGGILTGVIIAISRAIGETAPLIAIGAVAYMAFLPTHPLDPYTVLPIQMFNWISRPQTAYHLNAAAAGIVLLVLTLLLNGIAILVRSYFRKKYKW